MGNLIKSFVLSTVIVNAIAMLFVLTELKNQKSVNKTQDSLFLDLYYSIVDTFEKDAFLVTATTYNNTKEQCNKDYKTTASSLKIHSKSKYIALSRDLLEEFPYGSLVTLENAGNYNGVYVVADCMNVRFLRHVDILIKDKKHTKLYNVVLKHYKDG
jgi:3D (Asp-Asp-Asp) domain-containing protein